MLICYILDIIFYVIGGSLQLSWSMHLVFRNCICPLLSQKNKCVLHALMNLQMQTVFRNMVWMSLFLQILASLTTPSFLEYSRGKLWITGWMIPILAWWVHVYLLPCRTEWKIFKSEKYLLWSSILFLSCLITVVGVRDKGFQSIASQFENYTLEDHRCATQ